MEDYRNIMMREQAAARQKYDYDPRAQFLTTRYTNNAIVEPLVNGNGKGVEVDPADYGETYGSRADENSVQQSPDTRRFKRYIIIDASQRDWTKQPNPYTNLVYTFGSQTTSSSNPIVYSNNPFIPTFAVEQASNNPPIPGLPNVSGWTLSAGSSNVRYPPYNPNIPKGIVIGVDTGFTVNPSGSGFGSSTNINNVSSIRLVRAVLPQRQFLAIPIHDNSGSVVDLSTSAFIQSNIIGRPYSTFATYPYLLFNLNEFFGQYLGGNDQIRRSFSVMTQKQRQQANFQTDIGVQQYDYEAWGEEALPFQSPITNLQRLAITITDPIGTGFAQNDGLTISLIQASEDQMYLKCFTGSYQYFSSNELRVGDRVSFYGDAITAMLKSDFLNLLDKEKRFFITALSNATFPVLQLLDYVKDSNGQYVPRSSPRTTPYVSSYNAFIIPNFTTVQPDGSAVATYPRSIDTTNNNFVLEPPVLLGNGSNLPFLNVTLQPVYTLELETLEPDTSKIGGKIVVPR